jgi:hypothetical protein
VLGNIPADRRYPEAKKNAVIDRTSPWDAVAAFTPVIKACKAHGSLVIGQVTHAGRVRASAASAAQRVLTRMAANAGHRRADARVFVGCAGPAAWRDDVRQAAPAHDRRGSRRRRALRVRGEGALRCMQACFFLSERSR